MTLRSLLTHSVTVQRMTAGVGVQKSWSNVAIDVPTLIQPLEQQPNEAAASTWGKDFRAFFELDVDVREGDRLTDQLGRSFGVKGIKLHNYGPVQYQHLEAIIGLDGTKA